MQPTKSLKATTAIILAATLLTSTTGLLIIAGTAFGCEGAVAETELINETTKEKHAHFAPRVSVDEVFRDIFTWRREETVKGSHLDVLLGGEWEEIAECLSRTYLVGESCFVEFLIKCEGHKEVIAEQLIEIGVGQFARARYEGNCI